MKALPDEEGIETLAPIIPDLKTRCMKALPDEEGIETRRYTDPPAPEV